MNHYIKHISVVVGFFICFIFTSCLDDHISPEPPVADGVVDSNLPDEIRNGYSITFNLELGPVGGGNNSLSRAAVNTTNSYLRDIENFVDLERLRILFFVCVPEEGENDDPTIDKTAFKKKHTKDYFLFESKSRFITPLTNGESSSARWQVTAPVFTYGNNEEYDWEAIRYALTHYNFKIAILANRPNYVNFGNFDDKFGGKEVEFFTDRGPNWGVNETWIDPIFRSSDKYKDIENPEIHWKYRPTINDLHHCQWDAVYSSKNNYTHVYDFIMGNPWGTDIQTKKDKGSDVLSQPERNNPTAWDNRNMMGALSYWTQQKNGENYYILPSHSKGIPMYGVQKFISLGENWKEGTPFNVSNHENYNGDNIHLLRSLAKLELKIPRYVTDENGNKVEIKIKNPCLRYSNVMARCEPLDVETPTEILWAADESSCEWNYLFQYGPIVNNYDGYFTGKDNTAQREGIDKDNPYFYQEWVAWFYGAWRHWWHFNSYNSDVPYNPEELAKYVYHDPEGTYANVYGLKENNFFDIHNPKNLPYPHIFNPVVQRNGFAHLDDCEIADSEYWHYVVYTGERSINDPSYLRIFSPNTAEAAYFSFNVICPELGLTSIKPVESEGEGEGTEEPGGNTEVEAPEDNGVEYCIALADYTDNSEIRKYLTNPSLSDLRNYTISIAKNSTADALESSDIKKKWNWPLLRNHLYSFTVTKFKNAKDNGGIDVQVITSERRTAPPYVFE